jgi:integration host factor subunit alpha
MTHKKADIIEAISSKNGITKKRSTELVESLIGMMKDTLVSGDDILISGFGKFLVRDCPEKKGRNPNTGETVIIKPRRRISFKCSGKLREQINRS